MSSAIALAHEGMRFGRYEVVGHLATGGMARIYLAREATEAAPRSQRLYVIKQMLPSLAHEQRFLNMFIDEARIARRLCHPNIVRVYDTGKVEDSYFFSMEFLPGHPLTEVRRRLRRRPPHARTSFAIAVALQLCAALDYAHNRCDDDGLPLDIVHRDVSHSNVHIKHDGTVKLLDFGIARAHNRLEQTRAGVCKGKLRYMSPEQMKSAAIDRRSDIYSLGIVLWELSAGRQLFDQRTELEVLRAISAGWITPPSLVVPDYPIALEQILMKALARDPEDRFQTAAEMGRALAEYARVAGLDVSKKAVSALVAELFTTRAAPPTQAVERIAAIDAAAEDDDDLEPDIEIEFGDDPGAATGSGAAVTADIAVGGANDDDPNTFGASTHGDSATTLWRRPSPTRRRRRWVLWLALGASAGVLAELLNLGGVL